MKIFKIFGRKMAFVLTLAIVLTIAPVTANTASAANKKVTKVTVTAKAAAGTQLRENVKLTKALLKKIIKVGYTYKVGKTTKKVANYKGFSSPQIGEKVTANKAGKKKITVKAFGKKTSISLKVNKMTGISVSYSTLVLVEDEKFSDEAFRDSSKVKAFYQKGNTQTISDYEVVAPDIVKMEEDGYFRVTVNCGKFSDTIAIPVIKRGEPTPAPSVEPSQVPTDVPSVSPSAKPTPGNNGGGDIIIINPTPNCPTAKPSAKPTATPTPEYTVTVLSNHPTVKLNDSDLKFSDNTATEVVKAGTEISLSVQDSSNARYMRMINADTGEELSTSKFHKFTVSENITIMVVFEEVYTVTVKKVGGKGKVSISGTELEFYRDEATVRLVPGRHTLSAVAADGYKVTKWMDANGKDITTDASYTLAIPGNTTYTVWFTEEEKTVNVTYKHENGTVLKTDAVEFGQSLTPPTENIWRADKTFAGWTLNGTLYEGKYTDGEFYANGAKLSDAIVALTKEKKDVEITSTYVPNPPKHYTISAEGGTFSEPTEFAGKTSGSFELNTRVSVVANSAPEGKVFLHWEDSSGNIKSYKETWQFLASTDMEVKAVYGDKPVPAKPVVTLDGYTVETANCAISFTMSCQVPSNYTKIGWGILISTSLTGDQLNFNSGSKFEETLYASDRNVSNGGYDLTIDPTFFSTLTKFPARAYMVVQSTAGTEYYYSSPITVKVKE